MGVQRRGHPLRLPGEVYRLLSEGRPVFADIGGQAASLTGKALTHQGFKCLSFVRAHPDFTVPGFRDLFLPHQGKFFPNFDLENLLRL